MDALKKLMEKKKDKKVDPEYKKAKLGMLESLSEEMGGMMADDLKGLKKVTVASPDKEGLEKGLDKAKEMLDGEESEEVEEEACPACEMGSCDEHEVKDEMSLEDLEAKIKELEALKAKKMKE